MNEAVLSLLACPVCHSGLSASADAVTCQGCGRSYPIRNGIPVLIASAAGEAPEAKDLKV